jgi:hypothetical protein
LSPCTERSAKSGAGWPTSVLAGTHSAGISASSIQRAMAGNREVADVGVRA